MPPDNPPSINQGSFTHTPSEEGLLDLLLDLHLAGSKLQQVLTETLEAIELTPSEFYLLWQLSQRPVWIQSELAGRIGISPPQMSSLVERLRQREFLAVERSSTDRRRQHLRLARLGQATLQTAGEQLRPLSEAVDQQLSAAIQPSFSHHCRNLAQLNLRLPTRQRGAA